MFGLNELVECVNDIHYTKGKITEMIRNSYNIWVYKINNQWFIGKEITKC